MFAKTKIGRFRATWVLRHRWEGGANNRFENYEAFQIRNKWQLGVWAKRSLVVGTVKRGKDRSETAERTFGEDNLVNNYMIGMNLIVCEIWVDFTFAPTFGRK